MATQRYISTSFWDDAWIQDIQPAAKLLYMYLLTNPLTNIAGIYKITTKRIAFDTGLSADRIETYLAEFQEAKKIYRSGEYIILPNWPKHQQFESRKKIQLGIAKIIEDLPVSLKTLLPKIGYAYPIDNISIPYTYDSNYSDLDLDLDLDTNVCDETEKNNTSGKTQKIEKQTFGEFGNVTLSEKDHGSLVASYGPDQTKRIIDKLSAYKESKGKKYKSDIGAIRQWVLESVNAQPLPAPPAICPHCGHEISDGICPNGNCPQYQEDFDAKPREA